MSELPPPAGEPYGAQPQQDPQQPRKKGLGVGAIVGIVLVALLVLVAVPLALFAFASRTNEADPPVAVVTEVTPDAVADDVDAKADAAALAVAVSTHFIDAIEAPTVEQEGDAYLVNDVAVPATPGVELRGFSATSSVDWCVWVHADGGTTKDYQYSATGGLEVGTCS